MARVRERQRGKEELGEETYAAPARRENNRKFVLLLSHVLYLVLYIRRHLRTR